MTDTLKTLFLMASLFSSAQAHAETYTFPADFKWCVATAGHQVEGDNIHSDWWEWEKLPGTIRNGDRSGKASQHIERMDEDVNWMKTLGANTYRMSIEWSRLEPKQGQFDEKAFAYYAREFALLKKNNITPFVTLHHFVQPQWFTQSGGWKRPDSPDVFLNFVKRAEAAFGKDIHFWTTFNEPSVVLMGGFGLGVMPPGDKNWDVWEPSVNILKAHALAYRYLHEQAKARNQKIMVGLAFHLRPLVSKWKILSPIVDYADHLTNWSLPLAVKTGRFHGIQKKHFLGMSIPWPTTIEIPGLTNTQDFLGVNYYTREYISLGLSSPQLRREPLPGLIGTELLNWGIDPEGFYVTLKKAHESFSEVPFFVTENGLNDPQDKYRPDYIRSHLAQLNKAMKEIPITVLGYCHWTLMDNFEWIEGFTPRFGLLEVDYETGNRKPRPSAEVIKNIFKKNTVEY